MHARMKVIISEHGCYLRDNMIPVSGSIHPCGIYYKSVSSDTLFNHGEESEYQQTSDACSYFRANDHHLEENLLRVEHSLKSLKTLVAVLGLLMLLGLIVAILGATLASATWNYVMNLSLHVNPSIKQDFAPPPSSPV